MSRDTREEVAGLQRRKVPRNSNTATASDWVGFISTVGDCDDNHHIDDCFYDGGDGDGDDGGGGGGDGGGGDQSGIIEGRSLKARGSPCSNALTSHSLR